MSNEITVKVKRVLVRDLKVVLDYLIANIDEAEVRDGKGRTFFNVIAFNYQAFKDALAETPSLDSVPEFQEFITEREKLRESGSLEEQFPALTKKYADAVKKQSEIETNYANYMNQEIEVTIQKALKTDVPKFKKLKTKVQKEIIIALGFMLALNLKEEKRIKKNKKV